MSTNSEDAHLPSWALGSERTLALLDLQQQQRRKIEHGQVLDVILAPEHLEIDDSWAIRIETTNHAPRALLPWNGVRDIIRGQGVYPVTLSVYDINPDDTHSWRLGDGGPGFVTLLAGVLRIDTDSSAATAGRYNITVIVRDSGGLEDSMEIRIRLINSNTPPEFDTITNHTITSLDEWTHTAAATDDNDDVLSYAYTVTPEPKTSTITFDDSTGGITWTPAKDDEGITFTFSYTVNDGQGGTDTASHDITVEAASGSKPVIKTSNPRLVPRREGATYTHTFIATDSDPLVSALDWSISGTSSATLTTSHKIVNGIRQAEGILTWTAPEVSVDTDYKVILTVTATGGNPPNESRAMAEFILRSNHNEKPKIAEIADFNVKRGSTKDVPITSTDAENDHRTFYEPLGPAWVTVTGAGKGASVSNSKITGNIRAAPPLSISTGGNAVRVAVRDTAHPDQVSDPEHITITVIDADSSPPVFKVSPTDAEAGSSLAGTTVDARYVIEDTGAGKATDMTLTIKSGDAKVHSKHKQTGDQWQFVVRATYPAAGTNNPIVVKATATGGVPADETAESEIWNVRTTAGSVDYHPRVTLTKPSKDPWVIPTKHAYRDDILLELTFPLAYTVTDHTGNTKQHSSPNYLSHELYFISPIENEGWRIAKGETDGEYGADAYYAELISYRSPPSATGTTTYEILIDAYTNVNNKSYNTQKRFNITVDWSKVPITEY